MILSNIIIPKPILNTANGAAEVLVFKYVLSVFGINKKGFSIKRILSLVLQ